jgi:WD40 repeat protein
VRTFSGHTKEVDALAFSPDNQWLISGARDGSVRVWNVGDLPKIGRGGAPGQRQPYDGRFDDALALTDSILLATWPGLR